MNNRTTTPDMIGLEAWLENTRVVLPLRAVSVHADITAGFADVAVDQLFEQTNTQPLDCRFLFPLPADAAAYRCEMHVNGRVILAKVEERSAARQHFKQLKASGRRAALAESERDNLFTLQLGNVQPGDRILMRFAYLQPVQRLREQRTLRIPVNPGVRYIPGEPLLRDNSGPGTIDDTNLVPDASRITPPRIDADHPDAAALHATVRLHGAGDLADDASSPSHPVVMKRDGEDLVAALAANGHLLDRDFIFTWNEKPPVTPIIRAWLDEKRRGLLEIRLPATGVSATQSASVSVTPSSQFPAPCSVGIPDVYCLLDRSGSMQGANWAGACKALAAFVPRLHPDTRLWLSLFESTVRDYDAVPVRAGDIDFGPDGKRIHHHGTAGGTELVPALRHLGDKMREHSAGRSTVVLLITDGEVGNEHGAVSAAQQLGCPVHLLGVAMTANDELDAIARSTGGRSVFLAPGEDIPAAVERFAPILRAPVITGLSLTPGWQTADESPLRNLCDGDDIVIPISATEDAAELTLTFESTQLFPVASPSPATAVSSGTRHLSLQRRQPLLVPLPHPPSRCVQTQRRSPGARQGIQSAFAGCCLHCLGRFRESPGRSDRDRPARHGSERTKLPALLLDQCRPDGLRPRAQTFRRAQKRRQVGPAVSAPQKGRLQHWHDRKHPSHSRRHHERPVVPQLAQRSGVFQVVAGDCPAAGATHQDVAFGLSRRFLSAADRSAIAATRANCRGHQQIVRPEFLASR
jgi:hypothetical protein